MISAVLVLRLFLVMSLVFGSFGKSYAQSVLDSDKKEVIRVVVYNRNLEDAFLYETLQHALLDTIEEYGPFELIASKDMEQGTAFNELRNANIDVLISAPTTNREKTTLPVYIPIDRGLLGVRICLVSTKAPKLTGIKSLVDLQASGFSVGLGAHWPDTKIFEQNGFNVVTSPIHESLFLMLDKSRFSCFSRSVNEIDEELKQYSQLNIEVDSNLVFIYPNADFIFVNKTNTQLHERLQKGLMKSINDHRYYDRFDRFFANELSEHIIFERKIIFLKNNNVSRQAIKAINQYGIASFILPKSSSAEQ